MKNKLNVLLNSIMAGVMIGIGVLVFLSTDRIVGAFVFSLGLVGVLLFKFKLYTGAIGYATLKDSLDMLIIFIGNAIGISFCYLWNADASEMFQAKLSLPLYLAFLKGIVCGILIYIPVETYRNKPFSESIWVIILCISGFILCGAEHCIADLGYMFVAKNFSLESFIFILVVAAGNSVGSLLFRKVQLYNKVELK